MLEWQQMIKKFYFLIFQFFRYKGFEVSLLHPNSQIYLDHRLKGLLLLGI